MTLKDETFFAMLGYQSAGVYQQSAIHHLIWMASPVMNADESWHFPVYKVHLAYSEIFWGCYATLWKDCV